MLKSAAPLHFVLIALITLRPVASSTPGWTIQVDRAGPMRIGMSVADAQQTLRDRNARLVANTPKEPVDNCAYLKSKRLPAGVSLMFSQRKFVRSDVYKVGIATADGAQVGDTEEHIKQLYLGHIRIEPHRYVPQGHYLIYTPGGSASAAYGMVFETDGAKVTAFRAGTLAAIALVEGCG